MFAFTHAHIPFAAGKQASERAWRCYDCCSLFYGTIKTDTEPGSDATVVNHRDEMGLTFCCWCYFRPPSFGGAFDGLVGRRCLVRQDRVTWERVQQERHIISHTACNGFDGTAGTIPAGQQHEARPRSSMARGSSRPERC